MHPLAFTKNSATSNPSTPQDPSVRCSRRLRGAEAVDLPSLEEVEKIARYNRSLQKTQNSPEKQGDSSSTPQDQLKKPAQDSTSPISGARKSQGCSNSRTNNSAQKSTGSSMKKPVKKDIWGSSGYRRRRRKRRRVDSDTEDFVELESENEDGEASENENDQIGEQMDTDNIDIDYKLETSNKTKNEDGVQASQDFGVPEKCSAMKGLSIDVHTKSPKDTSCKSPSQRSPRTSSQKSPRQSTDDSPTRSRSDSGLMPRSTRHSVEGRSPRSGDKNTSSLDSGQKSPRSASKSDELPVKNVSPLQNGNETINSVNGSRSSAQSAEKVEKPSLVNGFVDSGIGSSDSSGDSNDSVGKLISETAGQMQHSSVVGCIY